MNRIEQETVHKPLVAHIRARGVHGVVWWHTPNGAYLGKNRAKVGRIFKSHGVRAGVSDIVALHRSKFFALELKAPKGRPPTDSQLKFISDVQAAGGYGVVAEGLDEAVRCLEFWGLLRGKAA